MNKISETNINDQIISDFLNGKSISQIALQTNLDSSYITLLLYQEGIHYSTKISFGNSTYSNTN